MNIDKLEAVAVAKVEHRRAEQEAQRKKIAEIRANAQTFRRVQNSAGKALSYADVERIMQIPIDSLIQKFEGGERYSEGSYKMIRTDQAKYSILENENLAHDFKSDKTYNTLTYLQEQLQTTNLQKIARAAGEITGEEYILINTQAVADELEKALKIAKNDKELQDALKAAFGVKFARLDGDRLTIADREISLDDLGLEKKDLIDRFRANRERAKQEAAERARDHGPTLSI
jgi:hypothetical protein